MKLSIIVPVYNEGQTLRILLDNIKNIDLGEVEKEIIVIDDCSEDSSQKILLEENSKQVTKFFHSHNQGKGFAIRQGIKIARGDYVLFQDADLEYNPQDYIKLIQPIIDQKAKIVYGSRLSTQKTKFKLLYLFANKFLTFLTNLIYKSSLTDMETCYKLVPLKILREINLNANGFEIEAEITAKILRRGYEIVEVPINYTARSRRQGKKINFFDGIKTIHMLVKSKFKNIS
ncbi:MAG: glycosyltransferase family 2 protein [Candidatus Omnitrophota bacterium]